MQINGGAKAKKKLQITSVLSRKAWILIAQRNNAKNCFPLHPAGITSDCSQAHTRTQEGLLGSCRKTLGGSGAAPCYPHNNSPPERHACHVCEDGYFIPGRLTSGGKFPIQPEYEGTYLLYSNLKTRDPHQTNAKHIIWLTTKKKNYKVRFFSFLFLHLSFFPIHI